MAATRARLSTGYIYPHPYPYPCPHPYLDPYLLPLPVPLPFTLTLTLTLTLSLTLTLTFYPYPYPYPATLARPSTGCAPRKDVVCVARPTDLVCVARPTALAVARLQGLCQVAREFGISLPSKHRTLQNDQVASLIWHSAPRNSISARTPQVSDSSLACALATSIPANLPSITVRCFFFITLEPE